MLLSILFPPLVSTQGTLRDINLRKRQKDDKKTQTSGSTASNSLKIILRFYGIFVNRVWFCATHKNTSERKPFLSFL